jgi:hypothetical protein
MKIVTGEMEKLGSLGEIFCKDQPSLKLNQTLGFSIIEQIKTPLLKPI